ncbi:MAG: hypothetical protein R3F01_05420 [Lysobacteraceae bacterium]
MPAGFGEKCGFFVVLTGAGLVLLGSFLPPELLRVVVKAIGLSVELIGFLIWWVSWFRRNRNELRVSHAAVAEHFDREYVWFHQIVRWLRRFPVSQREALLRYIGYRQKQLILRVEALTGGFQRLAVLPMLVALYFQFEGWSFTDWDSFNINRPASLLVLGLAILYFTGWLAVRIRIRLDQYEMLLTESLIESDEAA